MAPRSRARASQVTASSPPAPKIADLPQDVLVRILALLPGVKERCVALQVVAGHRRMNCECTKLALARYAWSGFTATAAAFRRA